jgi:gluconate 2-dehydrogenase gamma chain
MSDSSLTRRTILRGATLVGATAAVAPTNLFGVDSPYINLSASEGGLLDAIVDRLIPSDELGPGAKEAGVVRYIDRALGDALASSRGAYTAGLVALDKYALASRGKAFLQLSAIDQESVLIDCETGAATGFAGSSAQFFAQLLNHVKQGMFADPSYGGNQNFVGWNLINYPGVRTAVTAVDQKALEANTLKPARQSVAEFGFDKEHHGN